MSNITIPELNHWGEDDVLRYSYTSTDMEYLEDKADRIYIVINALNKVEKKYDIHTTYSAEDDSPEVNLDIQIQTNEQYKRKKDKNI